MSAEHLAPVDDPKARRRCKCEFSGGGVWAKQCEFHRRLLGVKEAPSETGATCAPSATGATPVAWCVVGQHSGEELEHDLFQLEADAIHYAHRNGGVVKGLVYAGQSSPVEAVAIDLEKANVDLATESAMLRGLLSDLVEAVDGMDDLDEMDGDEFTDASKRLALAVEAARPQTDAALLDSPDMKGGE